MARYEEIIREWGLQDNVELKGFVPDKELVSLLDSSKLFVFPSGYDGFALAVAEAMACGLPCIISDIPVFRVIYDGAAILVKPNDADCLANTIKEVLINKSEMELLSSPGCLQVDSTGE